MLSKNRMTQFRPVFCGLLLVLCLSSLVFGQGASYPGTPIALARGGLPLAGATVTVCSGNVATNVLSSPPCSPYASIYSDPALAVPITQPGFKTDGLGNYPFFAAAGTTYTICLTGSGFVGSCTAWNAPMSAGGAANFSQINNTKAISNTASELGAQATAAFTGCSAGVRCALTIGPGTYSLTAATAVPLGSHVHCESGAIININAAVNAFTLGTTQTVSTYSPNPTEIDGCTFTTSTAGAQAIVLAEFATNAFAYHNFAHNFCPGAAYYFITLTGQNWDSRIFENKGWADTGTSCTYSGIANLAGDPANGANGDFGQSQPVITNNQFQNSASHTLGIGIQINGANTIVTDNSIAGFMPPINIGAYGNESVLIANRMEQPFTSFTGACIEYGDYSGTRTGSFLDGVVLIANTCNVHNRDLTTTSHFMGPATASTGLQNSQILFNKAGSASATEPLVVLNNSASQTGNIGYGNQLNASGTAFTAVPAGQLHSSGGSINAWNGADENLTATAITGFNSANFVPYNVAAGGSGHEFFVGGVLKWQLINGSFNPGSDNSQSLGVTGVAASNVFAHKYSFGTTASLFASDTAPTIAAGGCGGAAASIATNNGTIAFSVNVGTTPTTACTLTMPTATNGWNCFATDITTNSTSVFLQKQTATGATTVTITNFNDVAVAANLTASDILQVSCFAR